ncbi:MAG: hypothetical protein O7G83_16815 [Proteobacteria bacterium]|nr:hypothetical protein [Pseudomonadota bacterium]
MPGKSLGRGLDVARRPAARMADRVADPGVAANDAEQGRRALEKGVAGGRQRLVGPLPRTFVLDHVDDDADLGSRGIPVHFVRLRLVESN